MSLGSPEPLKRRRFGCKTAMRSKAWF
jgi:hypothetical protein